MKKVIKKILPECIKERMIFLSAQKKFTKLSRKIILVRHTKPILFLLATPNHGNVGDQAIAMAERYFLDKEVFQYYVVEIMYNEYLLWKEKLKNIIKKEDIICYHGGGNMGTQYFECEEVFRDIIKRFSDNVIITFPQTIHYGDSEFSQKEFDNSKKVYASNPKLILVAREKYSYEIMEKAYGETNKVLLVPDIVLYLDKQTSKKRDGVLTCLRRDVERKLSDEDHEYIYTFLQNNYEVIKRSDTIVDMDYISKEMRRKVVGKKIEEFQKAELVITDRLHGMVFSYLTQTPCIVLSNYNHKVRGIYEWIKEIPYITMIDKVTDLEKALLCIKKATNSEENDIKIKDLFVELSNIIMNVVEINDKKY